LKLLYPDASQDVPDDDLESAVRLALECRRRVKEQQKRIGTAEFRNTQFSYSMGLDGGHDEAVGLYRIEVNEGPGSGVRILNQSPPAPFRESVRIAEQNLYARGAELVGDRNPREHEFTVQLRSFDAARSADHTGVPVLLALASASRTARQAWLVSPPIFLTASSTFWPS
jgi:ATP-dependent Lon protease